MNNKCCGDCRIYNHDFNLCLYWRYEDITAASNVCSCFAPITKGDLIRQMNNEELAELFNSSKIDLKVCNSCKSETCCSKDCKKSYLAWLNAPAAPKEEMTTSCPE